MITERRISARGITLSYCESGAGEPTVFLHGPGPFGDGNGPFIRQPNWLADQFGLITVDRLDFGRIGYPADRKHINRLGRADHAPGGCLGGQRQGRAMSDLLALDGLSVHFAWRFGNGCDDAAH